MHPRILIDGQGHKNLMSCSALLLLLLVLLVLVLLLLLPVRSSVLLSSKAPRTLMSVSGSTLFAVDWPNPIIPPRPPPPIPPIDDMDVANRRVIQMSTPTMSSVGASLISSEAGDVSEMYLQPSNHRFIYGVSTAPLSVATTTLTQLTRE